jgi:type VI protein secretion system component Hcp
VSPDSNFDSGGVLPSPCYFLKIPEIKGDAVHRDHPGEITLRSWSWGEKQNMVFKQDVKNTSSVSMRKFKFRATTGAASPQLFLFCASAKILKSATLTCIKPKGNDFTTYLTVELTNVIVTSYKIEGQDGSFIPADNFSLSFRKIEIKFSGEKPDRTSAGNFSAAWDLSTDKS